MFSFAFFSSPLPLGPTQKGEESCVISKNIKQMLLLSFLLLTNLSNQYKWGVVGSTGNAWTVFRYHQMGLMEEQRFVDFKARSKCCDHWLSLPAQNRPDDLTPWFLCGWKVDSGYDVTVLIAFAVSGCWGALKPGFLHGQTTRGACVSVVQSVVPVAICACVSRPWGS